MKKDVIYIDVDDDVTAIIGKIKKTEEKLVALVPPKRSSALQSAVNLRLIQRMVNSEKKHLVLVTSNQALMGLAAAAKIPVAKNLQTKPEIPEIAALIVDDDDDIIDGASIPVGEHAKTSKTATKSGPTRNAAIADVDVSLDDSDERSPIEKAAKPPKKAGKGKKVPNFDTFRKKLFLAIGGGLALIGLLVWMFVFAPAATVIITAITTPSPVSASVQLGGTAATNYENGIISSLSQKDTIDATVEFEATGEKDVGERASGTLRISRMVQSDYSVPAGTRFLADGLGFTTLEPAVIPASVPCFPAFCAQSVEVEVAAESPGTNYNGVSGSATNTSGINGTFQGSTSGGTTKIAKVVTSGDVERARGVLMGESTDEYKEELIAKFTNGEKVIDSSFVVERGDVTSKPAIDEEAPDGKAVLSMELDVSIQAVSQGELESFLRSYLEARMDDDQPQSIFDTGADSATIGNFREEGDVSLVTINTTGRIGPEIDEDMVKEDVGGLIYGEVQSLLEARSGVKEVDVQFSYFWVRTVPNSTDKIEIEFKVEDE